MRKRFNNNCCNESWWFVWLSIRIQISSPPRSLRFDWGKHFSFHVEETEIRTFPRPRLYSSSFLETIAFKVPYNCGVLGLRSSWRTRRIWMDCECIGVMNCIEPDIGIVSLSAGLRLLGAVNQKRSFFIFWLSFRKTTATTTTRETGQQQQMTSTTNTHHVQGSQFESKEKVVDMTFISGIWEMRWFLCPFFFISRSWEEQKRKNSWLFVEAAPCWSLWLSVRPSKLLWSWWWLVRVTWLGDCRVISPVI